MFPSHAKPYAKTRLDAHRYAMILLYMERRNQRSLYPKIGS